jgi:hypothetical protein
MDGAPNLYRYVKTLHSAVQGNRIWQIGSVFVLEIGPGFSPDILEPKTFGAFSTRDMSPDVHGSSEKTYPRG